MSPRTLKMSILLPGTITWNEEGKPIIQGWSFTYPRWKRLLLRTPWFTQAAAITADIGAEPNYRIAGWPINQLQDIALSTRRIEA